MGPSRRSEERNCRWSPFGGQSLCPKIDVVRLVGWTMPPRIALALVLTSAAVVGAFLVREVIAAGQAASQEPSRMETYDDLLVRVDERAPGFGGMFIDLDGRLAVYLLDTRQLPAARSAIEAVFGSNRVPAAGVHALQGQYTVSQLKAWTERAGAVLKMPGVTLVDLDESKNRVTIGVEDGSQRLAVEQTLSSLGVPSKAVVIQVTGPIRLLDPR